MSTEILKYVNGGSFGYEVDVTAEIVADEEVILDFGSGYDMVGLVQLRTADGAVSSLGDAQITYPAEGQIKIAENTVTANALANSLKTITNAHGADGTEHGTSADATNYPITTADATDITTLIALTTDLLVAYDAHDGDAELAADWVFHNAQETGDHSLVSAVAPTTLEECITKLNDLKAKYNAHDADATAHTTGSEHQEATADGSSTFAFTEGTVLNVIPRRKKATS